MKTHKLKRHLNDDQAKKLKGKYISDKDYDLLITEDCDGYDLYGNLLFKFRKNVIPFEVLKNGYESFKSSIEMTESRGAASGSSHKRIRKDGSVSKITVGNKVESGNVGFMDKSSMVRYCRKTAFAKKYFSQYKKGIPFVEFISQKYKELVPGKFEKQNAIKVGTDQNYIIGDSCFTTVTVNKNFRTAIHQDAGDFRDGFGNLIVYSEGDLKGGYFTLPEYRVAVDLQNTDILFVDVHKWHGNTEIVLKNEDSLRISFVMYYREYMYKCGSPSEELKNVKIDQTGFLKL